jgi:hypothetical protein
LSSKPRDGDAAVPRKSLGDVHFIATANHFRLRCQIRSRNRNWFHRSKKIRKTRA